MNKRNLVVIYALLTIIIALLMYIILQNNQMQADFINGANYLSEKIDDLTSIVQTNLID